MPESKSVMAGTSGSRAVQRHDGLASAPAAVEVDDFGLPIRQYPSPDSTTKEIQGSASEDEKEASSGKHQEQEVVGGANHSTTEARDLQRCRGGGATSDEETEAFHDARLKLDDEPSRSSLDGEPAENAPDPAAPRTHGHGNQPHPSNKATTGPDVEIEAVETEVSQCGTDSARTAGKKGADGKASDPAEEAFSPKPERLSLSKAPHGHDGGKASMSHDPGISEFSHQKSSARPEKESESGDDDGWQVMPAYAPYDMYDDNNRMIAREFNPVEEEEDQGPGLGGAGKGYTRVIMDEDAQSATSMDDNTKYLFKEVHGTSVAGVEDDARDAMSQMQATKDLLTEGQRIAYVGVVRLEIAKLVQEGENFQPSKKTKKEVTMAAEALRMWGQKMMIRLYSHMDVSAAEQVMIEQLAEHGVTPADLTPALLANARVRNPMAETSGSPREAGSKSAPPSTDPDDELPAEAPPPYSEKQEKEEVPRIQSPSELPTTDKIDIDLRWTVLCDLFLILIADSTYDARSRVLLERVGASLDVSWPDVCRFEKRVTDALEMQQAAEKENWNEEQHMETRRKLGKKRRYVMMGLATVGGGLIIGLSAGLLAPVIGAGVAAGFTTLGVTGTSGFLAGAGGAAVITSSAAASGGIIGIRAAHRRTGAVRTFEYRPLHNHKRVNLIVTVSGWLTGKVDDVRLPFSTVDPTMGDLYSVLWEPEMLRSTGDTINILATEALTQGLQQILGSTILVSLMAALQLPIVLTKLSYLIDNPWAVSLDRALSAGQILADSLMERNLGSRPITLVGYSLGSRVIFSCLQELAKKGAYGLVQNVYLFGSPVVVKRDEYLRAHTVVSGRFVNGYNRNDWILGYLFRLTNGGIRRVAGLAPIEDCPWIENLDVTGEVHGHMEYRRAMPILLMKCGWMVESEEFSEIEDPDPENHQERQRELINEIQEARKELEQEGKASKVGGRFGIFGRRKKAERQEWEVYEDSEAKDGQRDGAKSNQGVLFDIDAIRAELAKEAAEGNMDELPIKEIPSTLPPMKLDLSTSASASASPATPHEASPWAAGRSSDASPGTRRSSEGRSPRRTVLLPGVPSARHSSAQWGGAGEGEAHMGFNADLHDPQRAGPATTSQAESGERPSIRASQTAPNITVPSPWADPDDEDFGQEKEITMTFA